MLSARQSSKNSSSTSITSLYSFVLPSVVFLLYNIADFGGLISADTELMDTF